MIRSNSQQSFNPLRKALSLFASALPLVLVLLVALVTITDAAHSPVPSSTLRIATVAHEPGLVFATGDGFSPGGTVLLTITSELVPDMSYSIWTTASEAVFGPNGSQDPAQGYVAAGEINTFFALNSGEIHGPNGSQDPAQGYMRGTDWFAVACSAGISVHAFDAQTVSWSNEVQLNVNC